MNMTQLKNQIANSFMCIEGPKTSYFEIPIGKAQEEPTLRILYQSIATACVGEAEMNDEVLSGWLYNKLNSLLTYEVRVDRVAVLFWRMSPVLEEFIYEGKVCTVIRARLAVPGYDLSVMTIKDHGELRWL